MVEIEIKVFEVAVLVARVVVEVVVEFSSIASNQKYSYQK
jgi:hypothetical protein